MTKAKFGCGRRPEPALHIQYVERCLHPKPKGVRGAAAR
jgi:hypothetical protein